MNLFAVYYKTENTFTISMVFTGSKAKEKAKEIALTKFKFMINGLYGEWDGYYEEYNEIIKKSNSACKDKLYAINKEILDWSNADEIGDDICKNYTDFDLFCKELVDSTYPVGTLSVINTDSEYYNA